MFEDPCSHLFIPFFTPYHLIKFLKFMNSSRTNLSAFNNIQKQSFNQSTSPYGYQLCLYFPNSLFDLQTYTSKSINPQSSSLQIGLIHPSPTNLHYHLLPIFPIAQRPTNPILSPKHFKIFPFPP